MNDRPDREAGQQSGTALFMISVAAELSGVHPQTLRLYEQRRLIAPQRSPKGTRLYSMANVERLRRIQQLTAEGMSLTGVERLFELEDQLARAHRRIAALERRLDQARREAVAEIERIRRRGRAEVVLYRPPSPPAAPTRVRIPIKKSVPGSPSEVGDDQ